MFRFVLIFLIIVSVSACGPRRHPPAPVSYKYGAVNKPGYVTVNKGETVYRIAVNNDVPVKALIDENNLRPPYLIKPGELLKIPAKKVHVVAKGDTLYNISRRYGVDLHKLASGNNIRAPYTLSIGQTLRLPSALSQATTRTASATPQPKKTVQSPPKKVKNLIPPKRSGKYFQWPLRGKVVSTFGPKKGGLYNEGINISGKRGASIKAADNGVVAYAGNQIKGYGNLILLKHDSGWITAYAHADKLLVSRGQKIKVGQNIATVGSTGSVSSPQLHFEVRHNRKVVDPRKYLAK